jgi:hypothetical protein
MAKKQPSRGARWADAANEARIALDNLSSALDALKDVQSEYEDWNGNLPENLQGSALGEKLAAVTEIDFDCLSEVESAIDEAEGIDLPLGFGRD